MLCLWVFPEGIERSTVSKDGYEPEDGGPYDRQASRMHDPLGKLLIEESKVEAKDRELRERNR